MSRSWGTPKGDRRDSGPRVPRAHLRDDQVGVEVSWMCLGTV